MAGIASLKKLVVGRPKSIHHLEHERLSKRIALAVFASDALSSSAYATEEILLVLLMAGAAATWVSIPIAIAISVVLGIVAFSYRQTIHAYPSGGGAYIVAHDNLGKYPGLVAAAALLIDYVLTVAVSVAAGVAAVISAFPGLHTYRVWMALAVVGVITILNLRGVKEAGRIFAVPTYAFVILVGATLIWGLLRYFVLHSPIPPAPAVHMDVTGPLTLLLIAKAFSNGCTALTGVEAISNGVPAFKEPSDRNAMTTLTWMASILVTLFVGLTILARLYHVTGPTEEPHRTVVALIALRVFGQGPMFFAVQAATALILFLAANTSYADFPRLSAILSRDRFMPRQFMNRGDRLAYSNGIIALAAFAGLLLAVYGAEVSRLIHLYVVGVFTSFTLSQLGMVQHWRKAKAEERRWKRYIAINGTGAFATFIVLIIVVQAKFLTGAWIVIVAIPVLVALFDAVYRHYRHVASELRDPARRPRPARHNHAILTVGWPSEEERAGLAYAQMTSPTELRCVHFAGPSDDPSLIVEWGRQMPSAPSLDLVPSPGGINRALRDYVNAARARVHADDYVTALIPEKVRPGVRGALPNRREFLMKASLLFAKGVVVTDIPFSSENPPTWLHHPNPRHVVLALVSGSHNATIQALEYAKSLQSPDVRAVHVSLDPTRTESVVREWEAWGPGTPLEVLDSPYGGLVPPVRDYIRELVARDDTLVTVVLAEFTVRKWFHHFLHNQDAIAFKRGFLSEPNVVVTSVTYAI